MLRDTIGYELQYSSLAHGLGNSFENILLFGLQ